MFSIFLILEIGLWEPCFYTRLTTNGVIHDKSMSDCMHSRLPWKLAITSHHKKSKKGLKPPWKTLRYENDCMQLQVCHLVHYQCELNAWLVAYNMYSFYKRAGSWKSTMAHMMTHPTSTNRSVITRGGMTCGDHEISQKTTNILLVSDYNAKDWFWLCSLLGARDKCLWSVHILPEKFREM